MTVYPIYVANFLLLLCYTIALWIISSSNQKLRGMHLLAWGYTSACCACIIAAFGPSLTHWFVHAFAPELLLTAFVLLHYCFLSFVGRKPKRPWGWITMLCIGFAVFTLGGMDSGRILWRAIATALLLGFQTALSAYVLVRYSERSIKVPARTMALVYIMFSARSLARCYWILHFHALPERMQGWWMDLSGASAYLMLNAFTPLGFLWLATTRLQSNLEELSSIDPLTGTLNRRAFEEKGTAEVERARRYHLPIAVLAMDVDHFKLLNDSRGHACGDRVLVMIADAMRGLLRSSDHLARFGGDEFMILLPGTDSRGAYELAERLRARIGSIAIEFQGESVEVQASFGVATITVLQPGETDIDSWEQLLQRADTALYCAKGAGRNRVESAVDTLA